MRGRARAHNIYGWGDFSSLNANGDAIYTVPVTVSVPRIGTSTTATTLYVEWDAMTDSAVIGGFTILSYSLEQWDGSAWDIIQGDPTDLLLTQAIISPVSVGTSYKFRLRARNILGWSSYSSEVTLTPVDVPAMMAPLTTERISTNVKVTWTAPLNNGLTITQYKIMI